MTDSKAPTVSIGLPVFDGEKYLEQSIDSILAQTFTDFELILADNASTDSTPEICQKYAAQDPRVRYHRNPTNIGGGNNHNLTFHMSRGKYFRWAGHDDILAPEFLAKSVSILDENPSVVLCHSIVEEIDEQGEQIKVLDRDRGTSPKPHIRFSELTPLDYNCEEIYGLIRSDIFRKTGLERNYTDGDRTLICQLALYGQFYRLPEILFSRRIHPEMSTKVFADWRGRMAWFGPVNAAKLTCPHWMQLFDYLKIIATSPIGMREKVLCYLHMMYWVTQYRQWRYLGKDLVLVVGQFLGSIFRRRQPLVRGQNGSLPLS